MQTVGCHHSLNLRRLCRARRTLGNPLTNADGIRDMAVALTSTTALLEQGCSEPAELISLGDPLSVHVPKKVRPRR
jgi:hypothetical protein